MTCQAKLRSILSLILSTSVFKVAYYFYSSSVFFNPYHKNHLASSDYEGCVCIWDVNTGTKMINHQEHSKRVWSVVYNPAEPTMYASGSDDCTGNTQVTHTSDVAMYSPLHISPPPPFLSLSLHLPPFPISVKLWCTSRPHSIFKIDAKANVCSVRFHPVERHYLAYGSAG